MDRHHLHLLLKVQLARITTERENLFVVVWCLTPLTGRISCIIRNCVLRVMTFWQWLPASAGLRDRLGRVRSRATHRGKVVKMS